MPEEELSAAEITKEHNIKPECAEKLASGEELAEDDPCWENYTQVGMKPDPNGSGEVPNCVPDDDVDDASGYENSRANSRVLASRRLAGPIERVELSNGSVEYSNIKILSEGAWVDSESREEIYYDPKNLEVEDGAVVNVMHDNENDVSAVGAIEADSAYVEDGDLFADVILHRDNSASEYADENLQKTLESEGQVGFGGPSVEIPAEGQEIDFSSNPPELADGKVDGLAFVSQPAARTTAFAQQVSERSVALGHGDTNKGVFVKEDSMLELQDPGEVREILSMFGFDADDLDDEEVMDMAEDLHDDLMEELGGEEMAEGEEDMPEDGMDMQEMAERVEAMDQKMQEMKDKEAEMESEMQNLQDCMDMSYMAEEAEELEAELEAAKDRIRELEAEPEDPKSLSENGDFEFEESTIDYDRARNSF